MMKKVENPGRKIAQRFLRTAVVVDDEAYMAPSRIHGSKNDILEPGRYSPAPRQDDQDSLERITKHDLDAQSLIDSFSALGVICGVVGPGKKAMKAMRQADIVVLDWFLRDQNSGYTLVLLNKLLTKKQDRNSLRLVAIYTGEARLEDIRTKVFAVLEKGALEPKQNKTGMEISYRHGRVVIYAKSDVKLEKSLKDRSVPEKNLPKRLVEDFALMTAGLLPGIALTALTAVRQGEHQILDCFSAELDPAFLSHMTCLPNPAEAESQIVEHVAEELRGLVDEAVSAKSPAGVQAVESWIRHDGRTIFEFGDRQLDMEQTVELVTNGLDHSTTKLGKSHFKHLSKGFGQLGAARLDERLAWIMHFRTVFNAPPPRLWLGSVVTMDEAGDGRHLICMRPRCDSVRLEGETTFIFLPLVEPSKAMEQIVVRIGDEFERLGIQLDPAGWILRQFKPSEANRTVTATERESGSEFEFTDTCDQRYKWRGELKAEYAQRIAQTFAATLSRVAVNESEWLRRM